MNLKVTMVGDKAVAEALNRLGSNLSGNMMVKAVVSGAWILSARMKQLAPYLTGTLRRSLHIGGHTSLAAGFNPSEGYSDIGGEVITADRVGVETGTNLVYAGVQEFGGIIHAKPTPYVYGAYRGYMVFKTKDGKWHSVKSVQIPPTAYMRGAYLEKKPDVIQEIDLALDEMIRDALR